MSETISPVTYGIFETPANGPLIARLKSDGQEVSLLPQVRADRVAGDVSFDPTAFDWLVFMDVFGVSAFIERLRENTDDLFELDELTIFANGEAVADRLRFEQLHADVIPVQSFTQSAFDAILNYASGEIGTVRFLVIGGKDRPEIMHMLEESGGDVSFLQVYESSFAGPTAHVRALFKGGAFDSLILTSAEDLFALSVLASGERLAEFLDETKVSVTTESVFRAAREHGLRPLYFQQ